MNMDARLTRWVREGASLPVSCRVGGRQLRGVPGARTEWEYVDSNIIRFRHTATDAESGLVFRAECLEYRDFPVIEWTLWIDNPTERDSPVLSELYGMDGALPGEHPLIDYSNGDTTEYSLYSQWTCDLDREGSFEQHPDGGRASDCAWPYYRVLCGDGGYNLAIGWPGQWQAEFRAGEGTFDFRARQQYARFYLKPGETVRTPRMTVMTFRGGREEGINAWRRWMIRHVVPKAGGKPPVPGYALSDEPDNVVFFTQTTEARELRTLDNLKANGMLPEYYWIDAGWYECRGADGRNEWVNTGALRADAQRFPRGLGPVGRRCRELGTRLLLWFEPERIKLSLWGVEYPDDFVIRLSDPSVLDRVRLTGIDRSLIDDMGLLNLANPRCRRWLTDHVCDMIREFGVDVYRQDFNFPPLFWWLQHDEGEDRRGITENLYIQGYLAFWDELLLRNPGLLINSVSSGGRRSDLESLRRSVSMHQSDYGFGQHPVHQAIMAFSFMWQPFCGTQVRNHDREDGEYNYDWPYTRPEALQDFDNFAAHNGLCPLMYMNRQGMRALALPDGEFARTEEGRYYLRFRRIWEKAVPYVAEGDFYVLAMTDRTNRCYHAIQFHSEAEDAGMFQVIRNTHCDEDVFLAKLRAVDPGATYRITSPEFGRECTMTGREILERGVEVRIPRRSGEILFYRRQIDENST